MAPELHSACSIAHPCRTLMSSASNTVQQPQCHSGSITRTQIVLLSLRRQFGVGILHSCRKSRPPTMILLEKFDRAFAFDRAAKTMIRHGSERKCLAHTAKLAWK